MKRILILLIFLGLVTSAQATLSLSLNKTAIAVGETVVASVVSNDTSSWTNDFVLSEDLVNWTIPIVAYYSGSWTITGAGSSASALRETGYENVAYCLSAAGNPQPGTQFSINIIGVQTGTIYIGLQNPVTYANVTAPLTLTVIPEPMTLALLGLGGLFLRRRK
jgi:hypothetical protein